jgi:hypothetical protein
VPAMVLDVKRGADCVIVGLVIIGETCVAANATVAVKLSTAAHVKSSVRFVFIANSPF